MYNHGGVAKLVIALACHAGDHGFEPRRSRNKEAVQKLQFLNSPIFLRRKNRRTGNSAVGSALGSGPRGRRFKSALPDC